MSFLQRFCAWRDRMFPSDFVTHVARVDRQVAFYLIPFIDRAATGTADSWTLLQNIRFQNGSERPLLAIIDGDDISVRLEGPNYIVGDKAYPLGAQVFVNRTGWINLGPVDATELDAFLRKAIDVSAARWLAEHPNLPIATPHYEPRDRRWDDVDAFRMMDEASGPVPAESASHDA